MKMKKGHHPRPARLSILHQNQSSDSDELVSGGTWPPCRSERPLIAVPFDWEDQPGVPKQQEQKSSVHSSCELRDRDLKQSGNSTTNRAGAGHHKGVQSLTPPPRLMMLGSVTGACIDKRSSEQLYMDPVSGKKNASLNSPRSPRSISLSRKMKSLLAGRMNSAKSTEKIHSIHSINSINSIHSTPSLWDQAGFRKMIKEVDESEEDDYSASQSSSSNDIVFEGELLRSKLVSSPQQQQQPVSPFKNMSNLLLELWYGGSGSTSISSPVGMNHVAFEMISSSSSDLESPGSSTDNSLSSFSSDSYESHHHQQLQVQVPRQDHEIKTSFDSYDESSLNDDEQLLAAAARVGTVPDKVEEESDEDFSIDFHYSSSSSRDFFAQKLYYKSDRFRVESYESASLLGAKQDDEQEEQQLEQEEQVPVNVQPLPSALKKENSIARKSLKKVRFVFEVEEAEETAAVEEEEPCDNNEQEEPCDNNEQDEPQNSPVNTSPVLSRYSSRPASRFNEEEEADDTCSPSPRTKRDLSQLFMQIIQADVEMSRKQKGAGIKSMFRSRW